MTTLSSACAISRLDSYHILGLDKFAHSQSNVVIISEHLMYYICTHK